MARDKYTTTYIVIRIALLISVISLLSACAVQPRKSLPPDNWFGRDKAAHFSVSAAIAAVVTNYQRSHNKSDCEAARIGFGVTLAIGAAKETYDKYIKRTYWSLKDFTWDILGTSVGTLLASGC